MPILGQVTTALDAGITLGTAGSAGTGGSGTSTPSTPVTNAPSTGTNASTNVAVGTPIATWAIQLSETLYLNNSPEMGPTAWVPFTVRYVFSDGNAVLTREPDVVAYTGTFVVGTNLRRKGETYNSTYPGP